MIFMNMSRSESFHYEGGGVSLLWSENFYFQGWGGGGMSYYED